MCKDSGSGFKGFSLMTVNINWVDNEGFHTLAENIDLKISNNDFSGGIKSNLGTKLLEKQHPKIFAKIPTFTDGKFIFSRGLCFELVKVELLAELESFSFPVITDRKMVHPHSFFE
jgi:hypothetical protein